MGGGRDVRGERRGCDYARSGIRSNWNISLVVDDEYFLQVTYLCSLSMSLTTFMGTEEKNGRIREGWGKGI